MKHISLQSDDVPAAPFVMDRRRTPERRTAWRGGRRDSDWHHRPPGAWPRAIVRQAEAPRWRQVLALLNLW